MLEKLQGPIGFDILFNPFILSNIVIDLTCKLSNCNHRSGLPKYRLMKVIEQLYF